MPQDPIFDTAADQAAAAAVEFILGDHIRASLIPHLPALAAAFPAGHARLASGNSASAAHWLNIFGEPLRLDFHGDRYHDLSRAHIHNTLILLQAASDSITEGTISAINYVGNLMPIRPAHISTKPENTKEPTP